MRLRAPAVLLPEGWRSGVTIAVDAAGNIAAIDDGPADATLPGPVVPGLPNLHSHSFQRAMAGLAEQSSGAGDSFWTWRELMYRFLQRITPDDVGAIATQLQIEMLKAGTTALAEFHYLQHGPGGAPYDDRREMALRIIAAAETTGIGLTLLPCVYMQGGFGGAPLGPAQARFHETADQARAQVLGLTLWRGRDPQFAFGIAPHSLRAVPAAALADLSDLGCPIHIHAAEQAAEVAQCQAATGARPVRWLLDNAGIDPRWCLIHATHMDDGETADLAASGAVAGLCTTTEANLGDGVFPAEAYLAAGGRFGVGSDSHVCTDGAEELRWLEYNQRLHTRRRTVLAPAGGSVGAALLAGAWAGGAQATGRPVGRIAVGCRADLVVLDADHPSLYGRGGDALLDAWLFTAGRDAVRDVWVGGRQVVQDRRHAHETAAAQAYRACLGRLLG